MLIQFYDQHQVDSNEMSEKLNNFQKTMIEVATRDFRPKLKSFEMD